MPRRTKDELLNAFSLIVGDDARDEVLSFMDDLVASVGESGDAELEKLRTDLEEQRTQIEQLRIELENERKKLEENDLKWRDRYRTAFFHGGDEEYIESAKKKKIEESSPKGEEITYEDIFKEKKEED